MNYDALITTLAQVHQQAQAGAAGAVNRHHVLRNWLIGAYLVEFEQRGEDRAQYGERLLERVAADLTSLRMSGLGISMLKNCRQFFRLYPQIRQPAVGELSLPRLVLAIGQPAVGESTPSPIPSPAVTKTPANLPTLLSTDILLRFSWTHFIEFIRLDDPWKRAFYENECLKGNWSKRQLQWQIDSLLYERTGLSTDKQTVIEAARQQAADAPGQIADLIRDPYVLEFTGLADQPRYLVALPKPEQLQQLIETDRAVWEQRHPDSENKE
jgi:hypothetical protein